jgi:glycosyltransferase involved in cell wall biosynthesis
VPVNTFVLLCITSQAPEELGIVNDAFELVRERNPLLQLVVADEHCSPSLFQTSDLLICLGEDPVAATAIPRAQALGLPVLAVEGGPVAGLVESGRSGFIVPSGAVALSDAIRWLARRGPVRARLRIGGLLAAGHRLAVSA